MKFFNALSSCIFLATVFMLTSCLAKKASGPLVTINAPVLVLEQEANLSYMPQTKRVPAHVVVNKKVRYKFLQASATSQEAFSKEFLINPLMRNATMIAQVQKDGKKVREYPAIKPAPTILNNKSLWTPGRTKLSVIVPFIKPEEEIVILTSYDWMEPRWLWPFFMEEAEPTVSSSVKVDVPYGISMSFKSTAMGEPFALIPTSTPYVNSQWSQHDNREGQGTRFIFEKNFGIQNTPKKPGFRQQVYLAFDAPAQRDKKTLFTNWESVSSYLYDRFDRYDLPSNTIGDFCSASTKDLTTDGEKIAHILAFLTNNIEKRNVLETFQEQEVQPATRTFARRYGSPLDIVILGKAMLTSLQIGADIVAVSDPEQNPKLSDFFSPALFSKIILAIYDKNQTFYYDPLQDYARFDQIPTNLQGQHALSLKPSESQYFALPYESPEKNTTNYFYELTLNTMGTLEGKFTLDITGIKADQAYKIISQHSTTLSASALQNQLQSPDSALKWHKASLSEQEENILAEAESEEEHEEIDEERGTPKNSLRFSGQFSPRLLARAGTNSFLLPIKEIFEPVLLPLINKEHQAFSSLSTIEAAVSVPKNFKITHDKPFNFFIDRNGLRARFLVMWEPGTIIFKGESMVSLPIKTENNEAALILPQEQLTIIDTAQPEKAREASVKPQENS